MSPGKRPNRNGSFAPKTSSAPTPTNTTPRTSSTLPSSRSGSMQMATGAHFTRVTARNPRADMLDQFRAGEKVGDFKRGSLGRVGAMSAIVLDAGAQIFSDRAGRSFRGVGGTHGVAPLCDGVFRFEDHGHIFSGAHKFREVLEERTLAVHGVEAFGFRSCKPQRFDREDLKFRRVDAPNDFAGQPAPHGVRLYDCECSLDRHSIRSPEIKILRAQNSGALF